MKKLILTALILFMATPVMAQRRGLLTNVFASWYTVTNVQTTLAFPFNSRDIAIHNGSTVLLAVDLNGETIGINSGGGQNYASNSTTSPTTFLLDGNTALNLTDFPTDAISLRTFGASASPVSVIVTY